MQFEQFKAARLLMHAGRPVAGWTLSRAGVIVP